MLPVGRQVRERRAGNVIKLRKNITFKPSLWPAIERVDERSKVRVSSRSAFITVVLFVK